MNLRKIRKQAHLTQEQLAHRTGIKRVNIARYENGSRTPNVKIAALIATALGCTVDELLSSDDKDA